MSLLPLTSAQAGVWFAQQLDPHNPSHNVAEYVQIRGPLDPAIMQAALRRAVTDIEAARIRIVDDGDEVGQEILPVTDRPLTIVESDLDAAQARMRSELRRCSDLGPPPASWTLYRLAAEHWLLHCQASHAALDDYGFALVANRIAECYTALAEGRSCPPGPEPGALRRLIDEEPAYVASADFGQDRAYWSRLLAGRPDPVTLAGRHAPAAHGFLRSTGHLSAEAVVRLRDWARGARVAQPVALMTVLAVYLHRMTGADDLLIGLPVTGRKGALARSTPAMLTTELPLRARITSDTTLGELARQLSEQARAALRHGRYGRQRIRRDLGLAAPDQPLFGPVINIMSAGKGGLRFGPCQATLHNLANGPVDDLTVNVYDRAEDGALQIDFNANPAVYEVEHNATHLRRFLALTMEISEASLDTRLVSTERHPGKPDPVADTGQVPLTPIMHWLRELGGPIERYSQSMVIPVPAGISWDNLVAGLQTVLERHDVLRMRLHADDDRWRLEVQARGAVRAGEHLRRVDSSELRAVRAHADAARGRLAPESGTMLDAVWFDAGPDRPGRLLLVAHHLVIDRMSWRILTSDLAQAWRGDEVAPVATSFRRWARRLAVAAADTGELSFWTRMLSRPDPPLTPRPLDPARDTVATAATLTLALPATVRTDVPDVLLTGLTLAIAEWRRRNGLGIGTATLIDLEGHGRAEQLVQGADLTRTVGWFTSVFPVRIDPGNGSAEEALAQVRAQLRAVPRDGVGYGLLRYLNQRTGNRLAALPRPQVAFNYLGRSDSANDGLSVLAGAGADTRQPLAHCIEVNAVRRDSTLTATLTWATGLLTEQAVRDLADTWTRTLESLLGNAIGYPAQVSMPLVSPVRLRVDRSLTARPLRIDFGLPSTRLWEEMLLHALYGEREDH